MTISLLHAFASEKIDGGDATLIQPSNWNEEHVLEMATGVLLGRTTANAGPAEEISVDGTLALTAGELRVADGGIGSTQIANDAVTYAKLQNISAQYRILGRVSASAGNAEEITTTAFMVSRLADADAATLFGNIKQAASDSATGVVELATAAETTTGTDAARAVTPDGLAGSDYGKTVVSISVFPDSDDVATGDGAGNVFWRVPSVLNGYNLVACAAVVQTAGTTGTTDIQIRRVRSGSNADMLTTKITIDSGETDSSTAATPAVINASNDDVATADVIRIDVDATSTTKAKGLLVELTFQLP
jgi:hypothetical protein